MKFVRLIFASPFILLMILSVAGAVIIAGEENMTQVVDGLGRLGNKK